MSRSEYRAVAITQMCCGSIRRRTESRTFTGAEEYCWRLACESVEIRNGQSPRATFEKRSKGRPTCVSVLGSGRAAPSSAFFDFRPAPWRDQRCQPISFGLPSSGCTSLNYCLAAAPVTVQYLIYKVSHFKRHMLIRSKMFDLLLQFITLKAFSLHIHMPSGLILHRPDQ